MSGFYRYTPSVLGVPFIPRSPKLVAPEDDDDNVCEVDFYAYPLRGRAPLPVHFFFTCGLYIQDTMNSARENWQDYLDSVTTQDIKGTH